MNEHNVYRKFIEDRCHKLGITKKYSYEQAAFVYNMETSAYRQIVESIRF